MDTSLQNTPREAGAGALLGHNEENRDTLSREISEQGAKFDPGFSAAIIGPIKTLHEHSSTISLDENGEPKQKALEMDPTEQAIYDVQQTLSKFSMDNKGDEIVKTYEGVNEVLKDLDTLHTAIIQKHEADFVVGYKDHMVMVQKQMAEFKKKSSDFYLNMKKNEKISMLENSITFFREECIKMAQNIDELKTSNHKLSSQLKTEKTESQAWEQEAKTLKFYNVILKNTINQLKSPHLIDKYEERGRLLAEKEFKRLLVNNGRVSSAQGNKSRVGTAQNGRTKSYLITSGEGQIKESQTGPQGTIDQEYLNFEVEELGIETDIANKMRLLGQSRKSSHVDRLDPLQQLKMRPGDARYRNTKINANSQHSQSPLNASSFRDLKAMHKQMSQTRVGKQIYGQMQQNQNQTAESQNIQTITQGLPPTKPSSAHPSRRPRVMNNNRGNLGRMMSSRIRVTDRKIVRNKTTVASIKQQAEDVETKAVTNSHLWGDLGQSTSNSHLLSNSRLQAGIHQASSQELIGYNSESQLQSICNIVDLLQGQPEELKKQLKQELARQNEYTLNLAEKVRNLELTKAVKETNQNIKRQNQDLTLSNSHRGSTDVGQPSGVASHYENNNTTQNQHNQTYELNTSLLNSVQPGSRENQGVPRELLQDLFFDCIESLVKTQKSQQQLTHMMGTNSPIQGTSHRNINQVLQTQKVFSRMTDKSKQEVLLDFVQNKAVLRAIYDIMFSDKDIRMPSPLVQAGGDSGQIDFNRLFMMHQKDVSLLNKLPQLNEKHRRSTSGIGTKSATNLRSNRRRDSNSIDAAVKHSQEQEKQGLQETLNVVVEQYSTNQGDQFDDVAQHEQLTQVMNIVKDKNLNSSRQVGKISTSNLQTIGRNKNRSVTKQETLQDRVHTQHLPHEVSSQNAQEVLSSNDDMGQEMAYYKNRYEQRAASPMDSPSKKAYQLGTGHQISSSGVQSQSATYMLDDHTQQMQQYAGTNGYPRFNFVQNQQQNQNEPASAAQQHLQQSYAASGAPPQQQQHPALIIDRPFANNTKVPLTKNNKSKSGRSNGAVNRSFGHNALPKVMRPKHQGGGTQRPQSSYRIKDGKLLLGATQARYKNANSQL